MLAAALGLSMVALAVGASLELASSRAHLSDQAVQVLSTVFGAVAGGLAAYLGSAPRG